MTKTVAVLDYGSGNVHSACQALAAVGANVELTSDSRKILEADGALVPGVGAFATVMEKLMASGSDRLIDKRLTASRPVLGICVGMQVMFETGLEHGTQTQGLGQWPGVVRQLNAETLPHMGWTSVQPGAGSVLFEGIEDERFYFVHSYAATKFELDVMPPFVPPTLTFAHHGEDFLAAVENGPLSTTQFHPEKSGQAGLKLLSNWLKSL
ncbi:MAG: imidazole glycerol phosphate synthase subunit HisH [Micrococcales bacterium]|nr:imidazole glycerol phosphate synthase subunit HisH [Micrococcales bacterium]MBT5431907.1 imidazole glycerol phosphate synthase subunit HisH [Micrococcales bacterium]MBT5848373.1 imidazole glycerol phosphate synthase subunit HisH [Micrococcales bacterium]MBT7926441.1 imidazole glycerol phosphate synthase subunit HisH [Micrococcales bacterium]MDG2478710.1 imidazole glycerol phosphate synthase subunit HisH [Aquiluna sp.]